MQLHDVRTYKTKFDISRITHPMGFIDSFNEELLGREQPLSSRSSPKNLPDEQTPHFVLERRSLQSHCSHSLTMMTVILRL
jgi:hypothetical protein